MSAVASHVMSSCSTLLAVLSLSSSVWYRIWQRRNVHILVCHIGSRHAARLALCTKHLWPLALDESLCYQIHELISLMLQAEAGALPAATRLRAQRAADRAHNDAVLSAAGNDEQIARSLAHEDVQVNFDVCLTFLSQTLLMT